MQFLGGVQTNIDIFRGVQTNIYIFRGGRTKYGRFQGGQVYSNRNMQNLSSPPLKKFLTASLRLKILGGIILQFSPIYKSENPTQVWYREYLYSTFNKGLLKKIIILTACNLQSYTYTRACVLCVTMCSKRMDKFN